MSDMTKRIAELEALAHEIETQDNLATAHPVFVVQQKRTVYGVSDDYSDGSIWVYAGEECEFEDLDDSEIEDAILVGFADTWEFVTACFTRKGCEDYIKANGHNLKEPRIYVESAHRNREWIMLRALFPDMIERIAYLEGALCLLARALELADEAAGEQWSVGLIDRARKELEGKI